MTDWQYQTVKQPQGIELEAWLNEQGKKGWEYVDLHGTLYLFKRPVPNAQDQHNSLFEKTLEPRYSGN